MLIYTSAIILTVFKLRSLYMKTLQNYFPYLSRTLSLFLSISKTLIIPNPTNVSRIIHKVVEIVNNKFNSPSRV